jgi:hypothetical protein
MSCRHDHVVDHNDAGSQLRGKIHSSAGIPEDRCTERERGGRGVRNGLLLVRYGKEIQVFCNFSEPRPQP